MLPVARSRSSAWFSRQDAGSGLPHFEKLHFALPNTSIPKHFVYVNTLLKSIDELPLSCYYCRSPLWDATEQGEYTWCDFVSMNLRLSKD